MAAPASRGPVDTQAGGTILAVSLKGEALVFLRNFIQSPERVLDEARSFRQALAVLRHRPVAVLLIERDLPDASWKDVLAGVSEMPNPPCVVVTSRLADDALWAEVLNLGGYDVLAQPFDPKQLDRVISLACRHWNETRDTR